MAANWTKPKPWGGDAGMAWDMKTPAKRITKMKVFYKDWIIGMEITYIRDDGQETKQYGGTDGTPKEVTLDNQEYITTISGNIGKTDQGLIVIKQFTLVTNKERDLSFGPNETNNPFSLELLEGRIAGFFGRAGRQAVYMIGVYLAPMMG